MVNLNSLRRAGDSCKIETALIRANSSCLGMMLQQEHWKGLQQEHWKGLPLTPPL